MDVDSTIGGKLSRLVQRLSSVRLRACRSVLFWFAQMMRLFTVAKTTAASVSLTAASAIAVGVESKETTYLQLSRRRRNSTPTLSLTLSCSSLLVPRKTSLSYATQLRIVETSYNGWKGGRITMETSSVDLEDRF